MMAVHAVRLLTLLELPCWAWGESFLTKITMSTHQVRNVKFCS